MEQILSRLIAFETYEGNPSKREEVIALFHYVQQTLGKRYHYRMVEQNNYPSLLITPNKNRKPSVVLQAHVDVVPGPKALFTARKIGNRLYGRGASDMKCAVAAFIAVLKNNTFNHVGMWLTSDEEIGGFNGVAHVLQQGHRAKLCILPDGGDNWHIVEGAKGVVHFELQAKGKPAHGSRPWEGENAIEKLLPVLTTIKNMPLFKAKNNNHWNNTINIGKIEGGSATNSVPASATAYCDIRYVTPYQSARIIKDIRAVAQKQGVTVKKNISGNAFAIDKSSPFVQQFIAVLKKQGITHGFSRDHGSSDTRFFAQKHIPTIMCKPICGGHHTNKEWVNLKSLKQYTTVLTEFLHECH